MEVRIAEPGDAVEVSQILEELVVAGKRTSPSDVEFVKSQYIEHPSRIQCSVAIDSDGTILGFQSLRRVCGENSYGTPDGWGMIGTHIRPAAARRGVGRQLFVATREAAVRADIPQIEAFIGEKNSAAIAYYESIGFQTYRYAEGTVCKSFKVS